MQTLAGGAHADWPIGMLNNLNELPLKLAIGFQSGPQGWSLKVGSFDLRQRDVEMASKGATVSTLETLIADGDKGWDAPVGLGVRGRDVVLVVLAWAVLAGFLLFPALQVAALGASALVASAVDLGGE
ncbi:hypothetical protein DB459_26420 [Bradyrhizobium sp. WD16]|nr:hypothetical protein DB459_26420 [Bradyrhizobium sp. WD16]